MTNTRLHVLRMGLQAARAVWVLSIMLVMAAAVAQPAIAQTFTVLHEFKGVPDDGSNPHAGVVRDSAGNLFGTTFTGGAVGEGTVYKLDTAGHESVLFTFNNFNGSFPESGLILDAAGNLFGTAQEGPGGAGVLFRLAKDGTEVTFHAFQGGFDSEAAVPAGGVIMDEAGNLYGATLLGGLGPFPGFGTLYQVDPTGKFTVLYDFQGTSDGAEPQGPLVRDADGNLFGAALQGGTNNKGTIFKLATNGTLTVLHSFTGGRDGSAPQGGLLMDNAGNLFGSTLTGGDSSNGTVFEITKSGRFKRLRSFTGGSDGINPNGGLIQDADGNIYGTTQLGGRQSLGTAYKLGRAGTFTVLHTFTGGKDGANPFAGLLRDAAGNLFGTADQNFLLRQRGGTVFKITP
jgi:uncharacterized repeat protein (TIGR03803 family)